jgi:hypothetical protein
MSKSTDRAVVPPPPDTAAAPTDAETVADVEHTTNPEAVMSEPFAPRTYQSAWQFDAEGRPVLLTAEEWLEEEATVFAKTVDDEDDSPSRDGTMRAIAAEIARLRRDALLWAEQATRSVLRAPAPATDATKPGPGVVEVANFAAQFEAEFGAAAFARNHAAAPATDDAPTEAEAVERDAELLWRFWMREHRGDDLILWSEVAVKDEWRRVTRELRARLASPRATAPARNPMGEMPDGLTEADLIGGEF